MPASTLQTDVGVRAPLAFCAIALAVFGLGYTIVGTALGRAIFPAQAQGSLVRDGDAVRGSLLVAQGVASPAYFHARPSAAKFDPMAAAGSNQSRSNPDLQARIADATREVAAREGIAASNVPFDLVTQSGSGLDPHISPAAARVQVARVARARGQDVATIERLVDAAVEAPQWGVLGAPRVNVLRLNLELDAQAGAASR